MGNKNSNQQQNEKTEDEIQVQDSDESIELSQKGTNDKAGKEQAKKQTTPQQIVKYLEFTDNKLVKNWKVTKTGDNCAQKSQAVVDGVKFWSNFDSGNMEQVSLGSDGVFLVEIAPDAKDREPRITTGTIFRAWFYFKCQSAEQRTIKIRLNNLNANLCQKIWDGGKDVMFRETKDNGETIKKWGRVKTDSVEQQDKNRLEVTFTYTLEENTQTSFAFCYPWSYTHNQQYLKEYEQFIQSKWTGKQDGIYFHNQLLTYSNEGRRIEILTISSMKDITEQREELIPGLFPTDATKTGLDAERALQFKNQKYVLVGCRVHAGQTPASYMLRGFLNFLSENKGDSKIFLDNFVVVIIPMLNPDGVYRGHYRLDSNGFDLNRLYKYSLSDEQIFPSLAALLKVAQYYDKSSNKGLFAFLDLHATISYSNSFVYGNDHYDEEKKTSIHSFPTILGSLCDSFKKGKPSAYSIQKSTYMDDEDWFNLKFDNLPLHPEKLKLKFGGAAQLQQVETLVGIGQSDVYLTTGVEYCYTIEAAYDQFQSNAQPKSIKRFSVSDYQEVGRCMALTLLEVTQLRGEKSIIPKMGYKNYLELRSSVQEYLINQSVTPESSEKAEIEND